MKRTISASLSTMTSLPSCARYPSAGTPPIHIPFLFEAAILSRMRSPTHRGRRVELLCDRDKGGVPRIEDVDDLGKIGKRAGQPVDLVDDDDVDPPRGD